MQHAEKLRASIEKILTAEDPSSCNYFELITKLSRKREDYGDDWQESLNRLYEQVKEEIVNNPGPPVSEVSFGTSGWRGILGKDLFCKSVAQVSLAIVEMYKEIESDPQLQDVLGVESFADVCRKGCVIGFDNRFAGEILARVAIEVFSREGIKIYYAGESTTGVLSAAVLQLKTAFSINFTPSHNPLEYGGLKFNAFDGGPAASEITSTITARAKDIINRDRTPDCFTSGVHFVDNPSEAVEDIDSLGLWKKQVIENVSMHDLDYEETIKKFETADDFVVAIDSVHGASRLHIGGIFNDTRSDRLLLLRNEKDVTFGGVAPEPSSANMRDIIGTLQQRDERLKLGAIIDPDGDRIRFTDGDIEVSMNQFGGMAYHFLHEFREKKGMVAKTVASSNFANMLAESFGEEVFEPRVGFKEFKPIINKALVYFEESDGISIIGHTPEKDAYIGLLLALDMVLTTGKNLGEYLNEIESEFGFFYPDRGGITVSLKGEKLQSALSGLSKYEKGVSVEIAGILRKIEKVIDIDGRKIIFEDGSWLMIRPSGTEPKVRFYVESRTEDGAEALIEAAKMMLEEVGLLEN